MNRKEYYQKNKEKIKAAVKSYRERNKEKVSEKTKSWAQLNPEKMRAYRKKYEEENPVITLLRNCRGRARREGFPCDLDSAYLLSLEVPQVCPVLGIPINESSRDNKPSLDKIIPELGYVKGNVAFISMKANRLKNESTLQELKAIVSYIEKHTSR